MTCSSKLKDISNVAADYVHGNEDVCQQDEWKDLKNMHTSCSEVDLESTPQEPFSEVSTVTSVSNSQSNPDEILGRMFHEGAADTGDTDMRLETQEAEVQNTEYVYLNRLPGENLGMVLGIEGDQDNRQPIDAVVVKSVSPMSAVARSCQGTNRILVGDEIREIDGRPLNKLTHDECIALFQDMPDNVVLTIFRENKESEIHQEPLAVASMPTAVKRKAMATPNPRKKYVYSEASNLKQEHCLEEDSQFDSRITDNSNSGGKNQGDFNEHSVPKGFRQVDVTISRREGDNFGLSIVPSYGATCDLYQIKRLVHSGASAQTGLLEVGDRLLACNGQSLKGLTQSQCLNVLRSSGALIKLTVLRQTGGKEYIQPVDAESPRNHAKLTTSFSSDSSYIAVTQHTSGGIGELPRHLPQAVTDREIVNNTQIQDNILNNTRSSENNSFIDNINDCQFLDTDNAINTKGIVHEDKDCLLFANIPPPGEFSDADILKDVDFPENQTVNNVTVTDVDDLLFGTVLDTPSSKSENCDVLLSTNSEIDNDDPVVLLPYQKPDSSTSFITLNDSCTDSTDDAFTGQSIEEFANECFSNIGSTVLENVSTNTSKQSSESVTTPLTNDLLHAQEENDVNTVCNPVDYLIVSSASSSNDYDTKLPLCGALDYESHSSSESNSAPLPLGSNTSHTFDTDILDNSQPRVRKSNVDGVSDEHVVKEDTSVAVGIKHRSSNLVADTHEDITFVTPTSSTVTVDESCPVIADVNSHLNDTIGCSTVGVTNMFEPGEKYEGKEYVVIRDNDNTPPSFTSQQNIKELLAGSKVNTNESKPATSELNSTLTETSTMPTWPVISSNKTKEDVSEEEMEIVTTLETISEKKNVPNSWTSEMNSNTASAFHNTVLGILDTHRKSYEQSLPETALVHTTVGVSNNGQEERAIEPMVSAKDHQGRQFCIPSFISVQDNLEVNVPDYQAKLEIARVISSLVSLQPAGSQSHQNTDQSRDLVREAAIVPTVLSYDQKRIVANVLDTWANGDDRSSKQSTVQRAVTGFKIPQKHVDEIRASVYPEQSHEAEIVTENTSDSKQSSNADLHSSTKENEVSSILIPSDNINITHKAENIVAKSAKDFDDSLIVKSTSMQPEVKEMSGLNTPGNNPGVSSMHHTSDNVVLRKKLTQSADFNAQADKEAQSTDAGSSFINSRPRSMIITSSHATARFDDLHKSSTTESKPVAAFRSLSALRPLSSSSASIHHHTSASLNRPASGSFSSSTFATKIIRSDYPKVRQEDGSPFQVDVIKGIVGLGLKVKVTPQGGIQVTEVTRGGPIDKDGQIHIGDYILFINSTELTGQPDARVQQILRLLPRGLTKLVVSSAAPVPADSELQPLKSSYNSSILSTQSHKASAFQSTPSLNNGSSQVTLSQMKSHLSKTETVFPSQQVNYNINTAESSTGVSEEHVSEKVELMSTSGEKSILVDVSDNKHSPANYKHGHLATRVPGPDLPHLVSETHVEVNEHPKLNIPQDSTELQVLNTEPVPAQRQLAEGDMSILCKHKPDFKTDAELSSQDIVLKHTENSSSSVTHSGLSYEINPVSSYNQDTSAIYSSLSYQNLSQPQHKEMAEIKTQEIETSVSEEKIDEIKYSSPKVQSNQDIALKHTENSSNSVTHSGLSNEINPVSSNNQDTSAIYSPLSLSDLSQPHDIEIAEIKSEEREASVSKEKSSEIKYSLPKVPPPVAPKPRLSPASLKSTGDSVDGSQPIWPPLKNTFGDDKLQDDYKLQKPVIADKTSSFVSLTAKMFDDKTTSSNSAVHKTLVTRQVSREMVAQAGGSMAVNTSTTQDEHKNTLTKTTVSLSQPSALSRPRSLNYATSVSKEVTTDESSTKINENVDNKSNSVLSPTQLNAALSPRRKTSFDSPTSPPFNTSKRQLPTLKDESVGRLDSGKGQNIKKSGIYQTTPLSLVTNKPPPHLFSKEKSAPHSDQVLHTATSEHHIKPLTSSTPSSLSIKEEAMKQFENLLDDEFFPTTLETSQTVKSADSFNTQTEVKKPVALPRRKVEHKPNEIKLEVKDNEGLSKAISKEEIDQTQNKLILDEVKKYHQHSEVDNYNLGNFASEISNLPEERGTTSITEKVIESNEKTFSNIEIPEQIETSVTAENEIKTAINIFEMANKPHETNNSIRADFTDDHEQSLQLDLRMNDRDLLKVQQFQDSSQPEERTASGKEISESFDQQSLTSSMNSEVNGSREDKGFEANEAQLHFIEAYANQIVEELMTKIKDNPSALFKVESTNITEISTYSELYEEEPPALPNKEPPVPASPLHSPQNTDLLINTDYLMNLTDFCIVSEEVNNSLDMKIQSESMSMKEQLAVTNPAKPEMNANNESLDVINQSDVYEDNKTIADSVRPLYFNSNVYSADTIDINLTSPMDLLSEDSGMPADEDQDQATDDAVSPPSEFIEIGSHVVKKVPFSLKNDVEVCPISSSTQAYDKLVSDSQHNSKIPTDDLLGDLTYDSDDKGVSEKYIYQDNVHAQLLPTSGSVNATVQHSTTSFAEDLLSHNYLPSVETSVVPQSPSEVTLLCESISSEGSVELVQVPVTQLTPESKHDFVTQHQDSAPITSVSHSEVDIQDTDLLKAVDLPPVTVTSKRKWFLKSNTSRPPLLSGDSHVPVNLQYTKTTLISSLPPDHLRSDLEQANMVLDAVSAPDSLVLIVVHIHCSDGCTPLRFDITHTGSIWFQVSGLRANSILFEGDGIEDGDWLMSIGDEWCDEATVASFQTKLANWTPDQIMVFARGRNNTMETVSARPVPTPRSRSLEKQNSDQQAVSKAEYDDDFTDAAPQYEETILSETLPSLAEKPLLMPAQALLLDEESPLPDEAPPLPNQAPPLPDEAPPLPDQAPPLPDQAPPLPHKAPPLPDQTPLHPGSETQFPDQIPSLLNDAPPLIVETPKHPDQLLSLLEQTDHKSSLHEQSPLIADQELPPFKEVKLTIDQRSSLVKQVSTIPDHEPSQVKLTELSLDQSSSLPDKATSLPGQVNLLSDKVIVKEILPFSDEKKENLPDKLSFVVHETPKILANTEHARYTADKVTGHKINGGQEESSIAQQQPSPRKTLPAKEHLPAVNSIGSVPSTDELVPGIHKVMMLKGATGVGFCIEGGVGSPKGDMPIIIKRIFKGGPAEKCGQLRVGDEILEVNGVKFHSMRHYEAWNHLKFLDDGAVHITIQRHSS
ncbi:hypothetical protein BsWGS_01454 [Bradybaena similaris]